MTKGHDQRNREDYYEPEKSPRHEIFSHKWLDPVCVGNGCQSLFLKEAKEQLVSQAAEIDRLKHRLDLLGDVPSPTEDTLFALSSHHTWHHNRETELAADVARLSLKLAEKSEQKSVEHLNAHGFKTLLEQKTAECAQLRSE